MQGDTRDESGSATLEPEAGHAPGPGPGARVGPYVLRARLGAGGMGEVWEAWDPRLMRTTAVKLIRGGRRDDPRARARFMAEARALAALSHPAIVPIYDVGETEDGHLYLAMARVEGVPLARLIVAPWSTARALRLLTQLAAGLGAAHRAGIVHRDLKPSNVLIAADDRPCLIDFGLAERDGADLGAGRAGGTRGYIAPEVMAGGQAGSEVDVYALGVIAHHLLSGGTPTGGALPGTLAGLRPDLPPALVQLVDRCLAPDPRTRPPDGDALVAALEHVHQGPRAPRRALWLAGLAAVAIGAAVAASSAGVPLVLGPRPRLAIVATAATRERAEVAQAVAEVLRARLDNAPDAFEVVPLEATAPGLGDVTVRLAVGDDAGPIRVEAVVATRERDEVARWTVDGDAHEIATALAGELLELVEVEALDIGAARDAAPIEAWIGYVAARRAAMDGDVVRAAALADGARARAPGHVGLALLAITISERGAAVEDVERLRSRATERERLLLDVLVRIHETRAEDVLRALEAHLARYPHDVLVHDRKLKLLMHGGVSDLDRAEREAREVLRLAPDHLVAAGRLLRIMAWRGRIDEAAALTSGLARRAGGPGIARLEAELALYRGEPDRALSLLADHDDPTSFHWRLAALILRNQPGDCLRAAADAARRLRESELGAVALPGTAWTALLHRQANLCAGNYAVVRAGLIGIGQGEGLAVGIGAELGHALDLLAGHHDRVAEALAPIADRPPDDGALYRALFFLVWAGPDPAALGRWAADVRVRAGASPSWSAAGASWIRLAAALEARAHSLAGDHARAIAAHRANQVAPRDILLEGHLGERIAMAALLADAEERAGDPCAAKRSWSATQTMYAERLNQPWIDRLARERLAALEAVACGGAP